MKETTKSAILSSFAYGRQTALVVDVGHTGSRVALLVDGYLLHNGSLRSRRGGMVDKCTTKCIGGEQSVEWMGRWWWKWLASLLVKGRGASIQNSREFTYEEDKSLERDFFSFHVSSRSVV